MRDVNIIIFDFLESFVKWLDPDLADIEETSNENACRKIRITYPYEREVIDEDTKLWYRQGNKIYIPDINGITSCLYVINTQYEIDFWDKNTITVEAEEVLTELNYNMLSFPSGQNITITKAKLEEWFGMFYDIEGMDTLPSNRKIVSPEGIMSRMSLLRMIEEETGRTFQTTYDNEENHIKRTLYLADMTKTRYIAQTETLDLNYNLESLEFIKSEEDTYNAMCPVFNNQTNVVTAEEITNNPTMNISTAVINKAELRTENNNTIKLNTDLITIKDSLIDAGVIDGDTTTVPNGITQVDGDQLLTDWLAYTVEEGQEIPMIIQQDDDGNTVTTQTWSAPFSKEAGELYIKYTGVNQTEYNLVSPYNPGRSQVMFKCGKENTSETLMPAIYNELANSLLNKLMPSYELKISVKDIQDLLGLDNLGYQVGETLQVRVPNFNYYLPCRVTETVKNAHFPGENTIKIETEVTSIFDMVATEIVSQDRIIGENEVKTIFGGTLREVDSNVALPDRYVTMAIRLTKAYQGKGETTPQEQMVKKFDPVNETYIFDDIQIQNLEKAIRNDLIKNNYPSDYYKLRDVEGNVYSVPRQDCVAIYNARNNIYIANEQYYGDGVKLGYGSFDDTISVHWYDNPRELAKAGNQTFEHSKIYYYAVALEDLQRKNPVGDYGFGYSAEAQNGATCLPASMSNITAVLFTYHTEYELANLMKTNDSGTDRNEADKVMGDLGFKVERVPATWDNIVKYVNQNHLVSLSIAIERLGSGYYPGVYHSGSNGYHAINICGWYYWGNERRVLVQDTNVAVFAPWFQGDYTPEDAWVRWDDVLPAISVTYYDNTLYVLTNQLRAQGYQPYMTVISLTDKLLADVDESLQTALVNTGFEPELYNYKFKLDEIRSAIMEVMWFIMNSGMSLDIMSSSSTLSTANGVEMDNISLWWLRAMAFAGMYYYHTHKERTTDLVLEVGTKTPASLYYQRFSRVVDNVGAYDWFTACKADDLSYLFGYICSTLLFNLGIPYSPYDFSAGSTNYISYDLIGKTVVDKAGVLNGERVLHYTIVDITEMENMVPTDNRMRDSFQDTVMFLWATSSSLEQSASVKDSRYPLMIYRFDNGNVYYQNILGSGNSPGSKYDVLVTNSGNSNPWSATSKSNLLLWNQDVVELLSDGDKDKILVLSWYKDIGGMV